MRQEKQEAVSERAIPRDHVGDVHSYVEEVKKRLSSGGLTGRTPWVIAANPHTEILTMNAQRRRANEIPLTSQEILDLVLRPDVFVWAPDKLSGEPVRCPACNRPAVASEWNHARILHGVNTHKLYLTMRYACQNCPATANCSDKPESKKRASKKTFLADVPEVLTSLPLHTRILWNFVNTGQVMCDASVTDLVRALATKNSWSGIADAINETKASYWVRSKITLYLALCKSFGVRPNAVNPDLPKELQLSAGWVREFYVKDTAKRNLEISAAMAMERGDDTLLLDWTRDAAARCGKPYLLNAMDSGRHVLLSKLTEACKPQEAEALLMTLAQRGVRPKVVYVDDECCGAWPNILHKIWPGVEIKLDIFHAILRLSKTTRSTQHPWHSRFCNDLSEAFFQQDVAEVDRLRRAWVSDGRGTTLPKRIRNQYVPRTIAPPASIIANVKKTLQWFALNKHPEMGGLLTGATQSAWDRLEQHVKRNCLSEPILAERCETCPTMRVGTEVFTGARPGRGSSCLEGFHAHQKQWLGICGHHHAVAAGEALLEEGAVRWNRKRRNEATTEQTRVPNVFAGGVLQIADTLHAELTGEKLYPSLPRPAIE